jgi:hypothetical protein
LLYILIIKDHVFNFVHVINQFFLSLIVVANHLILAHPLQKQRKQNLEDGLHFLKYQILCSFKMNTSQYEKDRYFAENDNNCVIITMFISN